MNGLLESGGKTSSMRVSFLLITIGAVILMAATAVYISASAFNEIIPEPDWKEIGIFAVGLASVITGAGYNKMKQKKIEIDSEEKK